MTAPPTSRAVRSTSCSAKDVDAIIGAAASGVSVSVIDKITSAGVVHFSPANTAAGFDTYEDNGLYFRTAPSDRLQGQVLADLAAADGYTNIAIMARQDFYGEGLAEQVRTTFEEKGGTVSEFLLYSADAENFTAEVNKIAAAKPEALVLVAFEETTKIIPQLIAKGVGPQDLQIYFVDGNTADYSAEKFDLTGVKGTIPVPAELDPSFNDQLLDDRPQAEGLQLRPAVLRRHRSSSRWRPSRPDSDNGEAIGAEIVDVTREGTQCSSFEECAAAARGRRGHRLRRCQRSDGHERHR